MRHLLVALLLAISFTAMAANESPIYEMMLASVRLQYALNGLSASPSKAELQEVKELVARINAGLAQLSVK